MKIAIVSDIHSNIQALEAVLADIKKTDFDQVLCAGDIVGYGANPNECVRLVSKTAAHAVFGNHELAALTGDTIWMNEHAARAARWTGSVLEQEAKNYLSQLELSMQLDLSNRKIAMYHGSVDSAIEYVYEDGLSLDLFERAKADVLILGHTHVPYVVRFEHGLAVNPGSVGQPRDLDPRASYAILDPLNLTCDIRRVDYNVEEAVASIRAAPLPPFLAERLLMGR
ncbi:MAG: hypothetical protein A3K76_06730 [Euryarchaeota archaeon RBG_13_57_23]|nr:MAG: hypothetical protein A3K76_06730 [Euryarchaeota archaeon RBG_13_57_23]